MERLEPVFERVDQKIRGHLSSEVPFIIQVCEHILFSGGKRLRPALFVLAANLCGRDNGQEYRYAAIFEYLHAASLLHDDVVDQADMRRGRRAAHLVYGNQGVILVGDFLFAKALSLASETGRMDFIKILSETVVTLAEGEVQQLINARNTAITENEYEQVIHRKTGVLIEAACYLGAVLAGADQDRADRLRSYGRYIGRAFQVIDDTLDYSGSSREFGKPVGHDLDEGKITLPLIKTLSRADKGDKTELTALIGKKQRSPEEFARVKDMIDKYQGLQQSLDRAAQLVGEARACLDVFPDRPPKKDLNDLAEFIVTRRV